MADYNLYWGGGGVVDSVVDVTHNVIVPLDAYGFRIAGPDTLRDSTYNGGWGFLNQVAANNATSYDQRTVLTLGDIGCVEPYKTIGAAQAIIPCTGGAYVLSDTAKPGPIAFADQNVGRFRTATQATYQGFIIFIGAKIFQVELEAGNALPPAGTVWSMRDYVGGITGGNGFGGDQGPYAFNPVPRPFTAVGAELRAEYDVINQFNAPSNVDLSNVHTVPDPYYVTSEYEVDYTSKIIKFVNLPNQATIRIYSSSGVLVRVLNYTSTDAPNDPSGGMLDWNVRNRNNQVVASGVYFYHIEAGDARKIGRMTIVNYAQ
jgi:hypothetical protein